MAVNIGFIIIIIITITIIIIIIRNFTLVRIQDFFSTLFPSDIWCIIIIYTIVYTFSLMSIFFSFLCHWCIHWIINQYVGGKINLNDFVSFYFFLSLNLLYLSIHFYALFLASFSHFYSYLFPYAFIYIEDICSFQLLQFYGIESHPE